MASVGLQQVRGMSIGERSIRFEATDSFGTLFHCVLKGQKVSLPFKEPQQTATVGHLPSPREKLELRGAR